MFGLFKKKVYQHKIVYTYWLGSRRIRYEGIDKQQAEYAFGQGKTQQNVCAVEWARNGKKYKSYG